jgi:predicted aspartyl protease
MQPLTGTLDSSGSPVVRVTIRGVFLDSAREFDAILDTGFTGFISMPMVDAFPLGLTLLGTTTVVLADNSKSVKLTAIGMAGFAPDFLTAGVVILEWETGDVLIGMDFLRTQNKAVIVAPISQRVLIIEDQLPQDAPSGEATNGTGEEVVADTTPPTAAGGEAAGTVAAGTDAGPDAASGAGS